MLAKCNIAKEFAEQFAGVINNLPVVEVGYVKCICGHL